MMTHNTPHWEHGHSFGQDQKKAGEQRTILVTIITAIMMVVEIAAGVVFGSMALLADGLHMGSHAAALFISVFAYIYARKHAHNRDYSFGTGKVNTLGGFTGAILLGVFALIMIWESVERLLNPVTIAFNHAIFVAIIGLIVNAASVFILGGHGESTTTDDHEHDHNLKSAYYHVMADALTSILAIGALLAGKYFHWIWLDAMMGIVGAILICRWSWGLIQVTSEILLDKEVEGGLQQEIKQSIESSDDNQVVDLHIWAIGPQIYSVILVVVTARPKTPAHYKKLLPVGLGIEHVTIEIHPKT